MRLRPMYEGFSAKDPRYKSKRQIALMLGVSLSTMQRRLDMNGLKPDKYEKSRNLRIAVYGKKKQAKIIKLFKQEPIGSNVGRPKKGAK